MKTIMKKKQVIVILLLINRIHLFLFYELIMFDNEYIDSIYKKFITYYKNLLGLITNKNEYYYLKPWLDFLIYCIKELLAVYSKNKKHYNKLQIEFILMRKTNKIVSIETYIYENYDDLKMSKNFNDFREKIIDNIVINFSEYNIKKYYYEQITNTISFPQDFILIYNNLLQCLYLIYSSIYLNIYSKRQIKEMIIFDHRNFIKMLNRIDFRTDMILSMNM